MRRSKLKPTLEESFSIGKIEGHKEALAEITEMIKEGATLETLKVFVKAKSNTLNLQMVTNPFKQKDKT